MVNSASETGFMVFVLSVVGVLPAVNAKVAVLAGGDDVGRVQADGVTLAEVREGELDAASGEVGGHPVLFDAAAGEGAALVQAALPGALAAAFGAVVADVDGEGGPAWGVVLGGHGH